MILRDLLFFPQIGGLGSVDENKSEPGKTSVIT